MALLLAFTTNESPAETYLILYLSIHLTIWFIVTIAGWAKYHAKSNQLPPALQSALHKDTISGSQEIDSNVLSPALVPQTGLAWCQYFVLWKHKRWILLSCLAHIASQALNLAVVVELVWLTVHADGLDTWHLAVPELAELCGLSIFSLALYKLGSMVLIWKLSHSVLKCFLQMIDVTVLYQLFKDYRLRHRKNPARIVQYITYLNAMYQCWLHATAQLVFLIHTQQLSSSEYRFKQVVMLAFLLNMYCVIKAIYEKDILLTSQLYRSTKTHSQVLLHVVFRSVDVSLRVVSLSMLWITIGFIGLVWILVIELIIVSYLAVYTKQTQRFQEMVAVIVHASPASINVNPTPRDSISPLRPMTPATIRMTNELQVQLNVNMEDLVKKEQQRKREMMRECKCFKWRIITSIAYIVMFGWLSQTLSCVLCPADDDSKALLLLITLLCAAAAVVYPLLYYMLKRSDRWRDRSDIDDNDDIFTYLQHNDLESAREVLEFGRKISSEAYIKWASHRDFSADNNPLPLVKFLFEQNVQLSAVINKSQGGLNVLHQICKNPELENSLYTVNYLVHMGFDLVAKTEKTEDSALHIACSHCNQVVMLALLHKAKASDIDLLQERNKYGETALHSLMLGRYEQYAEQQTAMAAVLFERYTAKSVIQSVGIHRQSALHLACLNKSCPSQIIRLLLDQGANPYLKDGDGFYPKDHVMNPSDANRRDDAEQIIAWLDPNQQLEPVDTTDGDVDVQLTLPSNTVLPNVPRMSIKLTGDTLGVKKIRIYEESDDEDTQRIDPHNMVTPADPSPMADLEIDKSVSINVDRTPSKQ